MAVLEEHIIRIRHASDAKELAKIQGDAVKAAMVIDKAFGGAADSAEAAADRIADDHKKAAKQTSEVWTGALRRVGARMTDFGIAAAGHIASYVADTFEGVRVTDQFAKTLSVSSSEMMALEKGLERARVPAENTREAVKTLRENLGELARVGTGPAADSLRSLGLKFEDFEGKTPTEQLKLFSSALMNVQDPMKRTSIALEVMGEDGQRLMPAMLDGAEGIDALTNAAREAGQVLDEETIEQTRELDDKLLALKGQAEGVALSVMQEAVPAFERAAESSTTWVEENQELIDQGVPAAIELITLAAQGAAEAVLTVAKAMKDLRTSSDQSSIGRWMLGLQGIEVDENGNRVEAGKATGRRGGGSNASAEQRAALGAKRRARAEARRGERPGSYGPGDDELDRIAAARAGTQARIQRENAKLFEDSETGGGGTKKPRGRGKSKEAREREKALEAARTQAKEDLGEEFQRIGGRFGATSAGIEQAIESAAKTYTRGGNTAAARKSGLGTIGRLTDTKNITRQAKQDPLSALFGVDDLPDVSPADIAQDRAPDVLTATINNNFTIEQNFAIDGAARPDLIPDQVTDAFRSLFADEVSRQSDYVKVPFAR